MNKLPIEDYPDLLLEYGRAFAWLNLSESYLNLILLVKGGLTHANAKTVNQILDEMMLGKKISLASEFLPQDIVKRLWKLNNHRVLLAHGITGEEAPADNPTLRTGEISIQHKQKKQEFTKPFLNETIDLARELSEQLYQEIIKPITLKKDGATKA